MPITTLDKSISSLQLGTPAQSDVVPYVDLAEIDPKKRNKKSLFSSFKGSKGDKGDKGEGINGTNGTNGTNGAGVPVGGTAGQVLSKVNGTDYNTQWVDPSGGGGQTNVKRYVVFTADNTDNPIDVPNTDVVIMAGGSYRWCNLPSPGATGLVDGAEILIVNNSASGGHFQTDGFYIGYKGNPINYVTFSAYESWRVMYSASAGLWLVTDKSAAFP